MAISTNGTIIARLAGGLYNTVLSNATYLEVVAQDPSALANKLYAADFGKKTDAEVGTILVTNLGLASLTGLDAWVAAQLTAAGSNKGAKVVELLNGFSQMTADTTYGTYATAFNAKVDAALAASQTTGKAEGKFETAGVTAAVTSFTLTTSVEAIVGSAGDDTITAPATVATTGAAQTTINSGDSIDGGAGTDTLTLTITGSNNNSLTGLTIKGVENITYVGLDNLSTGTAAADAAKTAKATADAAVVTAAAALANASAMEEAYIDIHAFVNTNGGTTIEEKVALAAASTYTVPNGKLYSVAQINAAAKAVQTSAAGTTLITTNDDSTALTARALELKTAWGTAQDNAATAFTTASAAAATAAANNTVAAAAVTAATAVSIAANADATSITIDGTNAKVTGLKDTQTLTIKATPVTNTASYAAAATVANIALSSATGQITIGDGGATDVTTAAKSLATAKVTGSVKATAAADASGVSTPGGITLVDAITGTSALKTLTLGLTSDASVTATGMAAVATIDASTSTGGVALGTSAASTIGTGVMNITTGAGKDTVYFNPATTAVTTATLTASLNTGAGNDSIVVNHTGSGTATVNAGDGDDSVTMTSGITSATVDGGAGKDTVTVTNALGGTGATLAASFGVSNYKQLKALANFEVLAFSGTGDVDAAKASQFSEFTFKKSSSLSDNNFAFNVADTQIVNSTGNDVVATAAGYIAKGATPEDTGTTALSTTYAGALTIKAKGGTALTNDGTSVDVIANASSVALTVSVNGTSGTLNSASSFVTLAGDVKTATVSVDRANNNSGIPTADVFSTVSITPVTATANTTTLNTDEKVSYSATTLANTALSALGNLTSLTLTGAGVAIVNNTNGTKLTTVDASGLNGKALNVNGAVKVGDATAGLTWTGGVKAESVILGSALDTITLKLANSTYIAMDSITGFTLVADAVGELVTAKSDDIMVTAADGTTRTTGFTKASVSASTLDAALTAIAAKGGAATTYDKTVFQFGGNTYIFADSASLSTTLDEADTVIELIGSVDLDQLVAALNA